MKNTAAPGSSTFGSDLWLLCAILAIAFVIRLVYMLQMRQSPLFDALQLDELYHHQWAQAIVNRRAFVDGPYFRAPLYPYFLAALYSLFGQSYLAPRIVQAGLGSLSCGLVYLVGRQAFNRPIGLLAGLGAATYWMLVYFDGELHMPTLLVFLDLLLIWQLLRAGAKPTLPAYALAGITFGLSAVTRPDILPFAGAIVVWLVLQHRPRWAAAARYALSFTLGCLLPIVPVTVRNLVVGRDFVLIASQGGVNFYIGNNPLSDGRTAIVPGTPGDWWGGYSAAIARAEQALGRQLRPSEVSRYYYGQSLQFFRDRPQQALALLARKLWLFWNFREVSNDKGIYFFTDRFTPIVRFLPLGFWLIGPLGILGMVLCRRRALALFPLWGFVLVYMATVAAYFCNARYRTPVLAPLLILASYASVSLVDLARRRQWLALGRHLVLLLPALALVNAVPAQGRAADDCQSLRALGLAYREHRRLDLALECYQQAADLRPKSFSARYDLGTTFAQLGRFPEAVQQFQTALQLTSNPALGETAAEIARVHHNLGAALGKLGRTEEAVEHFRQAAALDPAGGDATLHFNLGMSLAALGRDGEAIDAFHQAVAQNPQQPNAHYNLGRVLARTGRTEEAAAEFRKVVQADPADGDAWRQLGRALVQLDRLGDAAAALRRSVELRPADASVVEDLCQALTRDGRAAEAEAAARRAIHQALADGNATLAESLTQRLHAYLPKDLPNDNR